MLDLQPTLSDALVLLRPLQAGDFEPLFRVASDPAIWVQHPTPTRYQRAVFENYFQGALTSGGALLIRSVASQEIIGCSRFYELDANAQHVKIGYTFFAVNCWRRGFNRACKTLMLDHALQQLETVYFEVGACNQRSQQAMRALGALEIGARDVAYFGEAANPNMVFAMTRARWMDVRPS
jgi:RimJ/RimL family protein N-acetyltransferase